MFTHDHSHETMRCCEARKKLIELADGSLASREHKALHQHLNQCSRCAQLALAEQLLTRDLEQLRHTEPSSIMTVGQVRERIAIREEYKKTMNLGVRIMRQVSETVYRRPRLSIASATIFVLLLASIFVPVRTEHAIGYEVALASPANGLILHEQNANKMLAALNMDDTRVEVCKSAGGIEYRIAPLEDSVQVQRLIAVLDSLGGGGTHRVVVTTQPGEKRTIWQLLLDEKKKSTTVPSPSTTPGGRHSAIALDDLDERFKDDFTLWIPVRDQSDDSLRGLLLDRQGDKTIGQFVGGMEIMPDDCGWNQFLNNSVIHTQTPEGEQATFYLYEIEDVRKLEKMGYNFVTMKWDTPRQVPIPGMGPKLNEIKPNPFRDAAMIEFMVPQAYEVRLQVLEEYGREVCTLRDCIVLAGIYSVVWDGRDTDGNQVEPGTYLCRLIAGDYLETQKIMLYR